jgi:hypothetical protein
MNFTNNSDATLSFSISSGFKVLIVSSVNAIEVKSETVLIALQRTGAKVIGVVLTLVKKVGDPYDYYPYSKT